MGYNYCFFLNFVPLHIESPYNFGGTGPILGVKNPLQRVNGHAASDSPQVITATYSLVSVALKKSIPFWRANWKSTCSAFPGAFPCAFRTWYVRASSVQLTGVPLGIDFMSCKNLVLSNWWLANFPILTSGSMFCACATGSCAISSLVGAFWPEVTKLRGRKRHCPEVDLTGSRFCACPVFPRVSFLVVVTWLLDVMKFDPFRVPLGVRSCATPVVTFGHVTTSEVSLGCSLWHPRPITIGNPASYI